MSNFFDKITHVVTTNTVQDISGTIDYSKIGTVLMFEGKPHKYLKSGLCRAVYISDCGTYVLKVAKGNVSSSFLEFTKEGIADPMCSELLHNIFEAKCYTDAPDNIKPLLAKTELLPNCVIKQEFVKVEEVNYGYGMYNFIREIGTTLEGQKVLFDYDYLLPDFVEPKTGFDYAKLERAFKDLKYI